MHGRKLQEAVGWQSLRRTKSGHPPAIGCLPFVVANDRRVANAAIAKTHKKNSEESIQKLCQPISVLLSLPRFRDLINDTSDIAWPVASMTDVRSRTNRVKKPPNVLPCVNRDSATRRARRLGVQFDVEELSFLRKGS